MKNPFLCLVGTLANLYSTATAEEQHDNIGLGAQVKHCF